jgi:hypothetical protein
MRGKLRASLTDDERQEWDQLRYDAAFRTIPAAEPLNPVDGVTEDTVVARPSHEAKQVYRDSLQEAARDGGEWAQRVLDDALLTGLGSDLGNWKKTRAVINFPHGSFITTKPAAMAFRQRRADGSTEYLTKDWGTCTLQDLSSKLAEADAQKLAAHTLGKLCRSLMRLMQSVPTAKIVNDALAAHGLNGIEEWFLQEAEKSHAA